VAWAIAIICVLACAVLLEFFLLIVDRTEWKQSREDLARLHETVRSMFDEIRRLRAVCKEKKFVVPTYETWRKMPTFSQDFDHAFATYRTLGEVVQEIPFREKDFDEYCRMVRKPRESAPGDLLAAVKQARLYSIDPQQPSYTEWVAKIGVTFQIRIKLQFLSSKDYSYDSHMDWDQDVVEERTAIPTWKVYVMYLKVSMIEPLDV
jgi:hypothetical protein